ncbi:MAG: M48 family metalloprotease [Planctomycetota bacterium]|nr:M48 family metalloprotease [Planctomycetota bacterium]
MKRKNLALALILFFGLVQVSCKAIKEGAGEVNKVVPIGDGNMERVNGVIDGATGMVDSFDDMSLKDERDVGEMLALQTYATEGFGKPIKDSRVMRYVNTLAAVVGRYSDRPLIPYFVAVIDSDKSNAFATPGGYIFITRGAIESMNSEAELACVIGHEIAHITERHAIGTIKRTKQAAAVGQMGAAVAGADQKAFDKLIRQVCADLLNKAFDSDDELGADTKGISYAYSAGYDPRAMLDFITTVDKNSKELQGAMSSHPAPDKRRGAVNDWLKETQEEEGSFDGLVKDHPRFAEFKKWIKSPNDKW